MASSPEKPDEPAPPPPAAPPPPTPSRTFGAQLLLPALAVAAVAVAFLVARHAPAPATPAPSAPPAVSNEFRLEPYLDDLVLAERLAQPRIDGAIRSYHSGALTEERLDFLMSHDIIPEYARQRDTLKSFPPLPPDMQARVDAAIAYGNMRAEMWLLAVRRAIGVPSQPVLTPEELDQLAHARRAAGLEAAFPSQP
jgi:hypothetical protein